MRTARWLVAALILAVSLGHAVVSAQVTTADLIGRVADTSGAVLPGVTITITHTGTGATRTQTSSDAGIRRPTGVRATSFRVYRVGGRHGHACLRVRGIGCGYCGCCSSAF